MLEKVGVESGWIMLSGWPLGSTRKPVGAGEEGKGGIVSVTPELLVYSGMARGSSPTKQRQTTPPTPPDTPPLTVTSAPPCSRVSS